MPRVEGVGDGGAPPSYREFPPPPPLATRVRCAWTLTASPGSPPKTVPPDGCMDVIFDLELGRAWFVGAMSRARTFAIRSPALLGVRFEPGGVTGLRARAADFQDLRPGLGDALIRSAVLGELGERLAVVSGASRERLLWAELSAWCADRDEPDGSVLAVAERVRKSGGTASVRGLADAVGVSERTLERRYARHVGLTPKQALRVERVNVARSLVEADEAEGGALASIARVAGYADQPHLTREFAELLGRPPGDWRSGMRPPPVGFVQDAGDPHP